MILIPQRLFSDGNVRTILREGNNCVLYKTLPEELIGREAYVSNHVVSIVLAGEQRIRTYDESDIRIRAGEVVFLPRGVYYVSDLKPADGPFRSLLFYFDDATIHDFLARTQVQSVNREAGADHLKFVQSPAVRTFADALLTIFGKERMGNEFLRLKTLELLHLIGAGTTSRKFAEFLFRITLPRKRNIHSFMERNFDKPLKVEDYAYLTGRSETTFRRDFKAQFNISPQKWIRERRISKAVDLLAERELPVVDLSREVGYENTSYFIRAFRARTGTSPKQYMIARRRERDEDG